MAAMERLDIKLNIDLTKIHVKHGCYRKTGHKAKHRSDKDPH